ncbi:winged helix-turn-helix domain-containing protein [Blautia wexlerae]
MQSNGIKVLLLQGQVFKNGELLDLTAAEYKLLCLFMRNPSMVLTKGQILDKLWDCDGNYIDSSTLTVYMRRLRMKIEDNPSEPQMLLTVRGIKDALDLVGLPYKDKKLFSQYSLGMKQRLAIALAVMHDPELLILDEPINGLDPIGIAEVRSFIRELCDARGKTILISSHILSEISLLADDIGIIDHGALLEEESLAELEQKSSKHIRFTLSDTAQAARILERNFHENHFSIQDDHNLRLHNLDLPVGKIVTAFVENGLEVSEAHTCEESLEDYFKRVTGGEGIA